MAERTADSAARKAGAELTEAEPIRVEPQTAQQALAGLPIAARMAFTFAARLRRGTLEVRLPDGRRFQFGGAEPGPAASMTIHDMAFARRFLAGGDLGIAEAYLRGEWETPDLTRFLYIFCVNHDVAGSLIEKNPAGRLMQLFRHWLHRNTKRQARKNIHAHYDLGNAFYSAWLDETMTYSSAIYERGSEDLAAAQTRKYQSLAERIQIAPGQTVLEIGCGWGGFAEYVAKNHDVKMVGLTISKEQHDYARERMFKQGLADRVEIRMQDYRDERGTYDRVASIEMIEAVGEQFWHRYFTQLRDRLKTGGLAGIQAITIQDKFYPSYRREVDFIRRYVFPGGMLPAPEILKSLGARIGLPFVGERIFGEDYARTLSEWRDRFRTAWPSLTPLGFDERFRRLWEYYLAYCEAGFLSHNIDVRQMVFSRAD